MAHGAHSAIEETQPDIQLQRLKEQLEQLEETAEDFQEAMKVWARQEALLFRSKKTRSADSDTPKSLIMKPSDHTRKFAMAWYTNLQLMLTSVGMVVDETIVSESLLLFDAWMCRSPPAAGTTPQDLGIPIVAIGLAVCKMRLSHLQYGYLITTMNAGGMAPPAKLLAKAALKVHRALDWNLVSPTVTNWCNAIFKRIAPLIFRANPGAAAKYQMVLYQTVIVRNRFTQIQCVTAEFPPKFMALGICSTMLASHGMLDASQLPSNGDSQAASSERSPSDGGPVISMQVMAEVADTTVDVVVHVASLVQQSLAACLTGCSQQSPEPEPVGSARPQNSGPSF